jgi:hypothetical protein
MYKSCKYRGKPFHYPHICFFYKKHPYWVLYICGSERIRTSGRCNPTTVFKTAAFNHSATLPNNSSMIHAKNGIGFGFLASFFRGRHLLDSLTSSLLIHTSIDCNVTCKLYTNRKIFQLFTKYNSLIEYPKPFRRNLPWIIKALPGVVCYTFAHYFRSYGLYLNYNAKYFFLTAVSQKSSLQQREQVLHSM